MEYAVLIGIVVCALMVMRFFMSRSIQEKYRKSADVFGEGEQYENVGPDHTVVIAEY